MVVQPFVGCRHGVRHCLLRKTKGSPPHYCALAPVVCRYFSRCLAYPFNGKTRNNTPSTRQGNNHLYKPGRRKRGASLHAFAQQIQCFLPCRQYGCHGLRIECNRQQGRKQVSTQYIHEQHIHRLWGPSLPKQLR